MAKKKVLKAVEPETEPVEIVEAMPVSDFQPGICTCGHTESAHNDIGRSCSTFLGPDAGYCACMKFQQEGGE